MITIGPRGDIKFMGIAICFFVLVFGCTAHAGDSGQIYCNNPNMPAKMGWPSGNYAHLLDWNGDGKVDIVRGSDYKGAYLHKNIGVRKNPPSSYRFAEPKEIFPKWAIGSRIVKPVDWNGDGKWDMIFSERIKTNGLDYLTLGRTPILPGNTRV